MAEGAGSSHESVLRERGDDSTESAYPTAAERGEAAGCGSILGRERKKRIELSGGEGLLLPSTMIFVSYLSSCPNGVMVIDLFLFEKGRGEVSHSTREAELNSNPGASRCFYSSCNVEITWN